MIYTFKTNGQVLTNNENSIFSNFLIGISEKPNTKLIYRGESIENLIYKLNINPHDNLNEKLNYFIFRIGEKGRVYQSQYSENLKSKSKFSIDETSDRFYKYIFNKINHVTSKSKDPEILEFNNKNKEFVEYFQEKGNMKTFIANINKLNIKEQIKVRDYYLKFLHRVGYLGFYMNTFMLSTTLSKEVAKTFSSDNDIIFVSWRTFIFSNKNRLIELNHLPQIKSLIFSKQKEVSLKGGLFPQYIIGFIERRENIFHINPNIFKYPNQINYMIKYGIPTNQDDFQGVRAKTNYSGFFTDNGFDLTDRI